MCDFEKGFKLCTCEEKINFRESPLFYKKKGKLVEVKKNRKQPPLQYIWILHRYIGKNKEIEMGSYGMPSNDIGKGLNAEWIALNLNCENCFDFDYTPCEGDNINFRQNVILGNYISFIFRSGIWVEDHYSVFDDITEKINEGLIKTINSKV